MGGTVLSPNGTALGSVPIEIELVLAKGFVVIGSYSLSGKLTVQTGADGTWSTPLQCNDELTPVGTLYQVSEKSPVYAGGTKVYLIQVVSGLPGGATINQVLNSIVPQAVPVGGTYSPVGSGPTGAAGPIGPPGYVVVADNAALNALPKIEGLPIWVTSTDVQWVWNGLFYEVINFPRFTSQALADAAFNAIGQHKGQPFYLQTNGQTEGPQWRNSNNSYTKAWHMPWGVISTVPAGGGTMALTTVLTTFVTLTNTPLKRNRQYRCSGYMRASTTSAGNNSIRITTPAAAVIANTTLSLDHYALAGVGYNSAIAWLAPFTVSVDGNYSIPIQAAVLTGTGTLWLDGVANVTIEDIGPSGAPL